MTVTTLTRMQRLRGRLAGALPPRLMAYADWVRPSRHVPYGGGPMNGQEARRAIVRRLMAAVDPELVVETGTHRGGSSAFLADVSGARLITVEAWARSYHFARWRLGPRSDIDVVHGDSRTFLIGLAADPDAAAARTVFYIDAHGGNELPLAGELETIAGTWSAAVVIVDDFQVPDDPGYGFDDWGPDARLTEATLPAAVDDWEWWYPAISSREETGQRRGCIVLVSPGVDIGPARGLLRAAERQR